MSLRARRVGTRFLEIADAGSFPVLELPGTLEIWLSAGKTEISEVVVGKGPFETCDHLQPKNEFSRPHLSSLVELEPVVLPAVVGVPLVSGGSASPHGASTRGASP